MTSANSATPGSEAIKAALRGYEPSDEQWAAVRAPLEPQWIVAGAGSGKTAVMTARIVWLVEQNLVRPSGVLGLTFTNKASFELEERLAQALGRLDPHPQEHPTVLTYHAFAASIVREHGPRLGIGGDAALLTEAQKWQMLMGLVDSLPELDALELRHPLSFIPQTLSLSEQCADHLITPEQLGDECGRLAGVSDERVKGVALRRRDFALIVRAYLDAKRRAGRIDYGDQITIAVDLLTKFEEVALGYRERFGVVMLDEYQDTNPAQKKLLQLICPPGSAVTAVGDARQAIYAWRGATMFNLIKFSSDFPKKDGSTYEPTSLATNYRSGARIVGVANAIIQSVAEERRPGRELVADASRGDGYVGVALFADQDQECDFLADTIDELHGTAPDGRDPPLEWRDFAILVRKRRYMDRIVSVLERRDIPVEIPELGGLLKVPPVVDVVSWMRVLADPGPSTNRWAARLLVGPRFRVHYRDLAPIARWAAERNYELLGSAKSMGILEPDPGEVAFSMLEALEAVDDGADVPNVSAEALERIHEFLQLRRELRDAAARPLGDLAQAIVEASGLAETLAASASRTAQAMARNVQTFVGVCAGFSPLEGEPTLTTFLEYLDAAEDSDDAIPVATGAPSDSVKVMTVHAAKGLEFEVVFLPVIAAGQETNRDGLRKGSVFPDVRASNPLTSTTQLPPDIRGDAAYLPRYDGNLARYGRELKERAEEDERRLLYVAVTRARRRLYCSAAHWYEGESCKGPSVFFDELAARPEALALREDEPPDENPLLPKLSRDLAWPPKPRADDRVLEWMNRVDALSDGRLAEADVLALGGAGSAERLAEHDRALDILLAQRDEARDFDGPPASLAATHAVRIAWHKQDWRDVLTASLEPATDARRLGIEVHAWIEQRGRGLLGLADEEALDELSLEPDPQTVRRLQDAYESMGYASRPLAVLDSGEPMCELPFTLKVAGRLVRGRIDAVFEDAGTPGRLEVVDFKTGAVPDEPDRGQLELYAEALAALGILHGTVTLTYAYLATARAVSWTYEPRGVQAFEDALRAALS